MIALVLLLIAKSAALVCPAGATRHQRAEAGRVSEEWCENSQRKRHGPRVFYYENGQRVVQELYVNGVQDGRTEYFFNDGTVWRRDEWERGKKVAEWVNPIVYKLTEAESIALGAGTCGGVHTRVTVRLGTAAPHRVAADRAAPGR